MKNFNAIRPKNIPFNLLMFIAAFTFLTTWLPLLRALFDGSTYEWGQSYYGLSFSGKGLTTDYTVLIFFFILYFFLFASFYWIKKRIIVYTLLFWWWMHAFGSLLFDIISNGDTMFHGDTLNIHVSLSAIVIPLSVIALVLIIIIIKKDRVLSDVAIPWGQSNTIKALVILGPVVLQAFFFATGKPHNITDQIGVIIAIVQALTFPIIFYPIKIKNKDTI